MNTEKAALALADFAVSIGAYWDEVLEELEGSVLSEEEAGEIREWLEQPH